MQRDDFRPTIVGTLAQQWDISRALWADYWHFKREQRRRAKRLRPFTIHLGHPGREDTLYWVLVGVALVAACVVVALSLAGVQ